MSISRRSVGARSFATACLLASFVLALPSPAAAECLSYYP